MSGYTEELVVRDKLQQCTQTYACIFLNEYLHTHTLHIVCTSTVHVIRIQKIYSKLFANFSRGHIEGTVFLNCVQNFEDHLSHLLPD